jgi:hypothetical protein
MSDKPKTPVGPFLLMFLVMLIIVGLKHTLTGN